MSLLPQLAENDQQTLEGMRLLAEAEDWNIQKGDPKETAEFLRRALRLRTGISWSVTNSRGTAYGWLKIRARGSRATNQYGNLSEEDQALLREALGFPQGDRSRVGRDGVSIPSGGRYYQEYTQRALGAEVTFRGTQYWD